MTAEGAFRSAARVEMAVPSRYLTQLCKHFEHKLPVTHDGKRGSIAFSAGTCALEAEDGVLVLRVSTEDEAALDRLEDVVARHLLRFAFREPPAICWVRAAPSAA